MKQHYEVIVADVETTGLNNHPTLGRPQVIELTTIPLDEDLVIYKNKLASVDIDYLSNALQAIAYTERFLPSMPIHPEAIKVHGIYYKDLMGCRKEETLTFSPTVKYMLGHNIKFDHRCLGKPDVKLICTMELAKVIDKHFKLNFDSHKQDNLIVHFYGEEARKVVKDKHDSFTDTVKTVMLLKKLLEFIPAIDSWQKLYEFQTILKGKKK